MLFNLVKFQQEDENQRAIDELSATQSSSQAEMAASSWRTTRQQYSERPSTSRVACSCVKLAREPNRTGTIRIEGVPKQVRDEVLGRLPQSGRMACDSACEQLRHLVPESAVEFATASLRCTPTPLLVKDGQLGVPALHLLCALSGAGAEALDSGVEIRASLVMTPAFLM